ncbi:unnamed protein product [Thelazia callipaeda]|uniref:RING-type domain-containing protein n=1 Tax=Thelazia callipaeda TaxID=103827 RepID=A0A0N5D3Q4_THECL|nr:unnamed protein product [Thelazia callipaeda]
MNQNMQSNEIGPNSNYANAATSSPPPQQTFPQIILDTREILVEKLSDVLTVLKTRERKQSYSTKKSIKYLDSEIKNYPSIPDAKISMLYDTLLVDLALHICVFEELSQAVYEKASIECINKVEERMDFKHASINRCSRIWSNFYAGTEEAVERKSVEVKNLYSSIEKLSENVDALEEQVSDLQKKLQKSDSVIIDMDGLIQKLTKEKETVQKRYVNTMQRLHIVKDQMVKFRITGKQKEVASGNEHIMVFIEGINNVFKKYVESLKQIIPKMSEKQLEIKLSTAVYDLVKLLLETSLELKNSNQPSDNLENWIEESNKENEVVKLENFVQMKINALTQKIEAQMTKTLRKWHEGDVTLTSIFFETATKIFTQNDTNLFITLVKMISDYSEGQNLKKLMLGSEMDVRKQWEMSIFRAHSQCRETLVKKLSEDSCAVWRWFQARTTNIHSDIFGILESPKKKKVSETKLSFKKLIDCSKMVDNTSVEDWPLLTNKLQTHLDENKDGKVKEKNLSDNITEYDESSNDSVLLDISDTLPQKSGHKHKSDSLPRESDDKQKVGPAIQKCYDKQEIEGILSNLGCKKELKKLKNIAFELRTQSEQAHTIQQEILNTLENIEEFAHTVKSFCTSISNEANKGSGLAAMIQAAQHFMPSEKFCGYERTVIELVLERERLQKQVLLSDCCIKNLQFLATKASVMEMDRICLKEELERSVIQSASLNAEDSFSQKSSEIHICQKTSSQTESFAASNISSSSVLQSLSTKYSKSQLQTESFTPQEKVFQPQTLLQPSQAVTTYQFQFSPSALSKLLPSNLKAKASNLKQSHLTSQKASSKLFQPHSTPESQTFSPKSLTPLLPQLQLSTSKPEDSKSKPKHSKSELESNEVISQHSILKSQVFSPQLRTSQQQPSTLADSSTQFSTSISQFSECNIQPSMESEELSEQQSTQQSQLSSSSKRKRRQKLKQRKR